MNPLFGNCSSFQTGEASIYHIYLSPDRCVRSWKRQMGAQENSTDGKTGDPCKISSSSPMPGVILHQESTRSFPSPRDLTPQDVELEAKQLHGI